MSEHMEASFETYLRSTAKDFSYPPTPDISSAVMKRIEQKNQRVFPRRLAWSFAILLILFTSLMLIPPARAALIDFIQIGIVQIFRGTPTPSPVTPESPIPAMPQMPLTATPAANFPSNLARVAGETDLLTAQKKAGFAIVLPSYPPDLGKPDKVYVQDMGGAIVILVWLDRVHPDQVLMSLHEVSSDSWAIKKFSPRVIQETTVNGQSAAWTEGPYMLQLRNGNYEETRLVEGNTLIWASGGVTYRLESKLTLEEAIKIAESVQPFEVPTPTP